MCIRDRVKGRQIYVGDGLTTYKFRIHSYDDTSTFYRAATTKGVEALGGPILSIRKIKPRYICVGWGPSNRSVFVTDGTFDLGINAANGSPMVRVQASPSMNVASLKKAIREELFNKNLISSATPVHFADADLKACLLYTSPSPRD